MSEQGRKKDDQTRQRVRKLAEQGMSQSQIARALMLNRETVRIIVREPPAR